MLIQKIDMFKILNCFFFISSFALLSYTDSIYVANKIEHGLMINLKYVTLFMGMGICLLQILYSKKNNFINFNSLVFTKELNKILFVIVIFLFISLCISLVTGNFTYNTITELLKLAIPVIYAFLILNTLKFKDIYNCMVFVLIFALVGYILELGIQTFTISNIKLISYADSYSPFESHYSASISISLCAFFMYFREKPLFKYISLIFVLLTFKRLSVIFAILLFILPKFLNPDAKVGRKINFIFKLYFIFMIFSYYLILQPDFSILFEQFFNSNTDDFTMGRSAFLQTILDSGYSSYGFGSTTDFLGKSMEMDLIKIYIELSIIGLIFFVNNYWDISGRHLYCFVFLLYVLVNLLTSHSLTSSFSWILIYIIIGTILYKREHDNTFFTYKRKFNKYKFVWNR